MASSEIGLLSCEAVVTREGGLVSIQRGFGANQTRQMCVLREDMGNPTSVYSMPILS